MATTTSSTKCIWRDTASGSAASDLQTTISKIYPSICTTHTYQERIDNLKKTLFKVADSIFASGYLTEGGQSLEETFRTIEAAGFTWQVESESSH